MPWSKPLFLAVGFCVMLPSVRAETLATARPHTFDIVLNFGAGLTTDEQAVLVQAANYWKSIITGYKATTGPAITGLKISVSSTTNDGAGGILAYTSAGGYVDEYGEDEQFSYATTASLVIDSDDAGSMLSGGYLYDVAVHEIAHALGFGTLWLNNGLYVSGSGQYTGAAALAAYRTEFNKPDATYVPVELEGGLGTANCHWDEVNVGAAATGITDSQGRDMRDELLTGWVNLPASSLFISQTTIHSFEDLGYTLVPEPGTLMLLGVAVGLLAWRTRRRSSPPV